jgi:hypothetical protein
LDSVGSTVSFKAWHDAAMYRGLVLAITLIATVAHAHVAPSVDDNNRYLKLTPQRDRVRLAYTVFFGEVPGGRMRPGLDGDRDGSISEAEAQAFGDKLGAEVAAALDVSVDGVQTKVVWTQIVAGMGSPAVKAGSFSIDLIAYFCLAAPGGRHTVLVRDRFRLQRPGETEVKIEDIPGVTIATGRVGPANDPRHEYRFVGPGGPLSDDGIELVFDASDEAPSGGAPCEARPARAAGGSNAIVFVIVLIAVAGGAIGLALWRRRRG